MFPGHRPGLTLDTMVLGTWVCSMGWARCGFMRVTPTPQSPGALTSVSSVGVYGDSPRPPTKLEETLQTSFSPPRERGPAPMDIGT